MSHIQMDWLTFKGNIATADGRSVQVWELSCDPTAAEVWSAWAHEFRQHYCSDELLDVLKVGTPYEHSRAEFLENLIFPDASAAPGPSIRSGDFAEILVGDFLEAKLQHWVPRLRFGAKSIRNESTKGTDVLGFKLAVGPVDFRPEDSLLTVEAKAQLTGRPPSSRLQDAVGDAVKDAKRKGESLNALRRRLIEQGRLGEAEIVNRFQDKLSKPYREMVGAAAVLCSSVFDASHTSASTTCSAYAADAELELFVFTSPEFMAIVTEIYRRARDEA